MPLRDRYHPAPALLCHRKPQPPNCPGQCIHTPFPFPCVSQCTVPPHRGSMPGSNPLHCAGGPCWLPSVCPGFLYAVLTPVHACQIPPLSYFFSQTIIVSITR